MQGIEPLDWLVIALYFLVILGIAWWVIKQKQETSTDYFLAGRHVGWFIIGASVFASNIGSEHIVGLAGTAAKTGLAMGHYELHAWCILLLGWVFVPFYMRTKVFTMPEFLEKRYSPTARWFLSLISLVAYVLTKISVTVYAGAVVFSTLMGVKFWTGALITVILTGIYTILYRKLAGICLAYWLDHNNDLRADQDRRLEQSSGNRWKRPFQPVFASRPP
jgi:SSS family solute:Na+ symporter